MNIIANYVTHDEFQTGVKELKNDMQMMELRLSKQLSEKIYDTYLKLLPMVIAIFSIHIGIIYFMLKH